MKFISACIYLIYTRKWAKCEDTDIKQNKSPALRHLQRSFLGRGQGISTIGILERDRAEVAMSHPTKKGIN